MKPLFVRFVERKLVGNNTQENRVEWLRNNKLVLLYLVYRTTKRDLKA